MGIPVRIRMMKSAYAAIGFAFLGCVLLSTAGLHHCAPGAAEAWRTGFYVWQTFDSPELYEAIERTRGSAADIMVLAAELSVENGRMKIHRKSKDWAALKSPRATITPVIRMHSAFAPMLADQSCKEPASALQRLISEIRQELADSGVDATGVQVDYDCPTAKLSDYHALLEELRIALPRLRVSITALPTWLQEPTFRTLARNLPYYVLQVHSLERPDSIDDPIQIYAGDRVDEYLKRARAVGVPFYVAFPTYGYRMIYHEDGRFTGMTAEGPELPVRPGYQTQTVMANADRIATDVRRFRERPPRYCKGIVWFRLPIDTDRLNWSWPTLQAVMEGRSPETRLEMEIRTQAEGLHEVWIVNRGERNVREPFRFTVAPKGLQVAAYDAVNGFTELEKAHQFTGPAPPPGEEWLAVWYRTAPNSEEPPLSLAVAAMEVH